MPQVETGKNQIQSTFTATPSNPELSATKTLLSGLLVVTKEELDAKLEAEKKG